MFGFHTWRGGGGGAGQGGVWRRDYPQGKGAPTRAGALCDYQDELLCISVGFFFFFSNIHDWNLLHLHTVSNAGSIWFHFYICAYNLILTMDEINHALVLKKKHFCALSAGLKAKSDRYGHWKQISWDMSDKHVQSKLYRLSSKETGRVKSRSNTFRSC